MSFLDKVIADKARELETRRKATPVSALHEAAANPVRGFAAAVANGSGVIAELKAKTPNRTSFRHSTNLNALATTYAQHGASAISIVTDEKRFGCSLATVGRVRHIVPLPVLVKDFIIDPYQVLEARASGADAVLLIARILDWDRLTSLLDLVHQLGMDALVETHTETEVSMALQARARIIGVNNRNLDTMEITLETTHRLASLIPDGVVLVSESGINTRADIDALRASGATAFLVGGALLDAEDPAHKLAELTAIASESNSNIRKGPLE